MAKRSYPCAHCGAQFLSAMEHATHVVQAHPQQGVVPKHQRLRRPTHCWGCAQPIEPTETHCVCGRPRPNYGDAA